MIQFILMLLGLAFSNNNANTVTTTDNSQNIPVTMQSDPSNATSLEGDGNGNGTGHGNGGNTGGNTGQVPPPYSLP